MVRKPELASSFVHLLSSVEAGSCILHGDNTPDVAVVVVVLVVVVVVVVNEFGDDVGADIESSDDNDDDACGGGGNDDDEEKGEDDDDDGLHVAASPTAQQLALFSSSCKPKSNMMSKSCRCWLWL